MDARKLVKHLAASIEYFYIDDHAKAGKPYYTPRGVGAFGKTMTDCYSFVTTIPGKGRFYISVEKLPDDPDPSGWEAV